MTNNLHQRLNKSVKNVLIIIFTLNCVLKCSVVGVVIKDTVVYSPTRAPYIITDDIIIDKTGHLTLEPGINMQFDPGVGIVVKGVLTAKGTQLKKITLTSSTRPSQRSPAPKLRLIDGPAPSRGRLQIFYKDKWRSVCTGSKNWTRTDREVACRELGFSGGHYYEWFDRPNNDTKTFSYVDPACMGSETSVTQCKWSRHAMGGGVCDLHPDMGLACDEYHALWKGTNHWRGIHFDEALFTDERIKDGLLFEKVSRSRLEHVTIEYAGMGPKREILAAVSSYKVPPSVKDVTIRYSAYTGVNFTMPDTFVNIKRSVIQHNDGIGIYVNTSTGSVTVSDDSVISDNLADGVRYNLHHKEPELRNSEQFLDFCSGATSPGQIYPLMVVARQPRHSYQKERCKRKFFTTDTSLLFTIHFIYSRVDKNDTGTIEVRDRDQYGALLARFSLRNDTIAPSVVSRSNSIFVDFKAEAEHQVVTYMQIFANKFKMPDVIFNNSISERNVGHGLSVHNMRSLVLVHKSNLSHNVFGSGLSVRGGAGDVNVTFSTIKNNIGDGVNVTYEGGVQNVTWSDVSYNEGRGVALWFNESARDPKTHQETGLAYSTIHNNLDVGVLVGNFCRSALVNISTNTFTDGKGPALQVESCWRENSDIRTLLVGHNTFKSNKRLAILVSPAVNMNMTVEWNEIHENERGSIKIYNEDEIEFESLPFRGLITENTLTYNTGIYVMLLSLNIRSGDQFLTVSRNRLKHNTVLDPYLNMASRSKSSGVVCIGSYNIELYRNLIENPDSIYELASHSQDQSSPINASYNWLGTKEEKQLFERVFDRRDRYNLGLIEFHPFLLSDNNMDTPVISPPQYTEPDFFDTKDETVIGGEVNGNIVLTKDFYKVVRDIYVQDTGLLTIPFGTTLEFNEGVGIMVTGTLRTEGSGNKKVRFTLSGITEMEKIKALIEHGHIDEIPDNMTSSNNTDSDGTDFADQEPDSSTPAIPIKLIGGKDETEGTLLAYKNGEWGTVCSHNFNEDSAAVACQQMGHVLNPQDWLLEGLDAPKVGPFLTDDGATPRVVMSNVQCDEFDTDFVGCKHDPVYEVENCPHAVNNAEFEELRDPYGSQASRSTVVALRCYPRRWAGIRFGMTARESHVKGVIIEKAGLLDFASRQFAPALQVDFNQHVLQEILIQDNSQDGIGVVRNNQFAITNRESRILKNCVIRKNRRHGVALSQLGLNISDSKIYDNHGSGIHFDPSITREKQRELAGWIMLRQHRTTLIPDLGASFNRINSVIGGSDGAVFHNNLNSPIGRGHDSVASFRNNFDSGSVATFTLKKDAHKVFVTQNLRGRNTEVTFTVTSTHSNVIGIQILNPIQHLSTEKIVIFDYPKVFYDEEVFRWDLKSDLSIFPTTSSSYAVTIKYTSGSSALGDTIIAFTAVEKRDIAENGDLFNFRPKVPTMLVKHSKLYRNDIGVSTLHYDRYLTDHEQDHLFRNSNETIAFFDSKIVDNKNHAVLVRSPYRVSMDNDNLSEITFMFNQSEISRNGKGIEQLSWNIRESNNLFHWVFESVTMESNGGGGVSLSLPFVWQYNENFTHSVYVNVSKFVDNTNFEFSIKGHFARVNITKNVFERNVCGKNKAVLSVTGMEKEMFIRSNVIKDNVGKYMLEFNTDSQSEIEGNVFAYFMFNSVQYNRRDGRKSSIMETNHEPSATFCVKGLQPMNITYNLFGDNEMDFELIAGLYTARIENRLNVRANWWGSKDVNVIREKIFDFDDWNNYAMALYRPFLTYGSFDATVAHGKRQDPIFDPDNDVLGGRLTKDLTLKTRVKPYVVRSDLTVMPDVTLRIEPGVRLEFYPSVGILVMGKLEAIGRRDMRITMKPVDLSSDVKYRVYRQANSDSMSRKKRFSDHRARNLPSLDHTGSNTDVEIVSRTRRQTYKDQKVEVRLCVEGNCTGRRSGFLDIYNATTEQWVPICDERFSERNAQVVCSQLGYNPINVFYTFDIRTEMYPNGLIRIRSWPEPIQCQGNEKRLEDCPIRMNGQIFDHTYACQWNEDFVYVDCGELNLPEGHFQHWGGIRFSIPNFEFTNLYDRIHDTDTPHAHHHTHEFVPDPSILAWVDVIGAGILHGKKSAAILSFYQTPKLLDVNIKNSAQDGVAYVSAHHSFELLHSKFENNLGVGVSLIGLTGETRETSESSFTPVLETRLPYHMFGMVDICDSAKELVVEERILLYYKYDNRPVDCVKIFASAYDVKTFGFRLLQFNLFNSSTDPLLPDRLVLFDGDIYNVTTRAEIASLNATSSDAMRLFTTQQTRLSVATHTTGASHVYGFVAEVVTFPISTIGLNRDLIHNLTYNQYYNNREGAVFGVTAGEVNPWVALTWSRLENNGLHLYGNVTTSKAAVNLDLQNMRHLYFKNNLVRNNTGGLRIMVGSNGAATKLSANITNNLFVGTQHWPSLYMVARKKSAYQHALIAYNDFSWAYIPYHDVITLAQVVSDFSYNYVHSNLGRHILDIYGFQKVRLPVYQITSHNSFAKNIAVDPAYPGTVVAGSPGQQYVDNVFYNLQNAYEMVAVNETMSALWRRCNISQECKSIHSLQDYQQFLREYRQDVWKSPVDARGNWWGYNTSVAVSGRIRDKLDDEKLIKVNYNNWKLDNRTLLHGCEPGYTKVADSCYLYVGAPITFGEAKKFCKRDNGSLPYLQNGFYELRRWLRIQQPEYQWDYDQVWVSNFDYLAGGCAAFVHEGIESVECDLNLPFICESVSIENTLIISWATDTLVLGVVAATILSLLLMLSFVACWVCKSKTRRKERMIRRNSIRASIRSNRSMISSTSGGFSDAGHRRRILDDPALMYPSKTSIATHGTEITMVEPTGSLIGSVSSRAGTGTFRGPLNGFSTLQGTFGDSNGINLSPMSYGAQSRPQNGLHGPHGGLQRGLNGSINSISKSNYSVEDDPSFVVYETSPNRQFVVPTQRIDDRFAHDTALENANVNMVLKPTYDLAYQNNAFKDNSTFVLAEDGIADEFSGHPYGVPVRSFVKPSDGLLDSDGGSSSGAYGDPVGPRVERVEGLVHNDWRMHNGDSEENEPFLAEKLNRPRSLFLPRSPTSFRDRSLGGSSTHLGPTGALVNLDDSADIHTRDTLPRDAPNEQKFFPDTGTNFQSPGVPYLADYIGASTPNSRSPSKAASLNSLSQGPPLETAM